RALIDEPAEPVPVGDGQEGVEVRCAEVRLVEGTDALAGHEAEARRAAVVSAAVPVPKAGHRERCGQSGAGGRRRAGHSVTPADFAANWSRTSSVMPSSEALGPFADGKDSLREACMGLFW